MSFLITLFSIAVLAAFTPKILDWILVFLPDSTGLPAGISTTLDLAVDSINAFSFILPITHVMIALNAYIIFRAAILLFKIVLRVIKTIRGTG